MAHTPEEIDHFSGKRTHWCIVYYIQYTPFYYMGFFNSENKPAFTIDFNKAMKCHSRIAAQQILDGINSCSGIGENNFKVEEHAWFGIEAEREGREL